MNFLLLSKSKIKEKVLIDFLKMSNLTMYNLDKKKIIDNHSCDKFDYVKNDDNYDMILYFTNINKNEYNKAKIKILFENKFYNFEGSTTNSIEDKENKYFHVVKQCFNKIILNQKIYDNYQTNLNSIYENYNLYGSLILLLEETLINTFDNNLEMIYYVDDDDIAVVSALSVNMQVGFKKFNKDVINEKTFIIYSNRPKNNINNFFCLEQLFT